MNYSITFIGCTFFSELPFDGGLNPIRKESRMENTNMTSQNEEVTNDLDAINALSEQSIREDYLTAALHGPRWILGLIDEAI